MVAAYTSNYLLLAIIVVATASVAQATLPIPPLPPLPIPPLPPFLPLPIPPLPPLPIPPVLPLPIPPLPSPTLNVSGVIVTGVYVQPANANISVARVNISLSCDGGATTIGTRATITSPIGAFQVATTTGNGTLFAQSKCAVYAYASIPNRLNASAIAYAPLLPLGILPGLNLTVANGQITVTVKIGSSIATYLAGLFRLVP